MCGRIRLDNPKEVTPMNKFLLAGTITAIADASLKIKTTDVTPGGEYTVEHEVFFTDDMPAVTIDERVQMMGKIGRNPEDLRSLRLECESDNVKDYAGKVDYNVARVHGKLHRGFEYLPPTADGKRGFGNFLIVVDETFYLRGAVLTSAAAMAIDRAVHTNKEGDKCKVYATGAFIHMEGRLQTRAFEGRDPETGLPEDRLALEIVVQPEKLEVLRLSDEEDPFAAFEKDTAEAI